MPIPSLRDVPDIIQSIVKRKKFVVTYGMPIETTRQFLLPMRYVLAPKGTPTLSHPIVRPLSSLQYEDPNECVVLSCTHSLDAADEAVSSYGNFLVMNYFTMDYMYPFFPALRNIPLNYRRTHKLKTARRGIIIRGASMGEYGVQAIQRFAADHPNDYIVISTWDTTPDPMKERLDQICDRLVLNPQPANHGLQSSNLQLGCIQPGIVALQEANVERILIARTDYFFANPYLLDICDNLLESHPSPAAHAFGQKGRMIVPDLGSRRYIPYHPGDMLTYGWAEDVARFWLGMPQDQRTFTQDVYRSVGPCSLKDVSQNYPVIETYMNANYMERIGRPIEWTLADSLAYMRDFFIMIDHSRCGMFWFKKTWHDRMNFHEHSAQFIDHSLWLALASGRPVEDFCDIDITKETWREFQNDF